MRTASDMTLISILAFVLTAGMSIPTSLEATDFKIVIKPQSKAFTPQEIKIKPGDTVTWISNDQEEHFLMSSLASSSPCLVGAPKCTGILIHKLLHPGDKYTYTFT